MRWKTRWVVLSHGMTGIYNATLYRDRRIGVYGERNLRIVFRGGLFYVEARIKQTQKG